MSTSPEPIPLEALEVASTGLLVLDEKWRIVWANAAVTTMAAVPVDRLRGSRLWDVLPRLRGRHEARAVRRTLQDGTPRSFRLEYQDGQVNGVFDVRVARAPNECVLLEIHDVSALLAPAATARSADVDAALLRALARALSEARDSDAILDTFADLARRATGASLSVVTAISGDRLVVLHASGRGIPERGTSLELQGSITERVARDREALQEPSYDAASASLLDLAREAAVGEVIAVPLVAYGQVVGVAFVGRIRGAEPFGSGAKRRFALLADHVSLPLWRARLLEQAEAANQAKTNFLATMSHELRTPLTALTGYGELLADGVLGELTEAQEDAVERMRAVTHHLTVIIDEILAYSNLETGPQQVNTARTDAREVVRSVAAIIEPLAEAKEIVLRLDLPDDAVELVSDADKIRQILVNLGSNAVKFTDRGRVTLRVCGVRDRVQFAVEDTGIGMTAEERAQLFQPFAQLDSGLTRRHGGTGLGLYISARLAELLGGEILVQSEPGRGSSFELLLPSGAP